MRLVICFVLVMLLMGLNLGARAAVIVEYTAVDPAGPVVDVSKLSAEAPRAYADAQCFFVGSAADTITELQLMIRRTSGTGSLIVQVYPNTTQPHALDAPSGSPILTVTKDITTIPSGAAWVSFQPASPVPVARGYYWIVCKMSADTEGEVQWSVADMSDNPTDARLLLRSQDRGLSWSGGVLYKSGFRVFGSRSTIFTQTTVMPSSASIPFGGQVNLAINVVNMFNPLFPIVPGLVFPSGQGTFGDASEELVNGQASITWSPPGVGTYIITVGYPATSLDGCDFQASQGSATISVVAQQVSTTTVQNLSTNSIRTRQNVNVTTTVTSGGAPVRNVGQVVFSCTDRHGSFVPNPVDLDANGKATTTWTADNSVGTFTIRSLYAGFTGGPTKYGASLDDDDVTVDYTDVATLTTLKISPDYPYKNGTSWVSVQVTDAQGNCNISNGSVSVAMPPQAGYLDDNPIPIHTGGFGYTKWHVSSQLFGLHMTGSYQQNISGGLRYLASSGGDDATIVHDTDSTGDKLSVMTEWNTDYTIWTYPATKPLPETGKESHGFMHKLEEFGWSSEDHGNSTAYETDMKAAAFGGSENDHMDKNDFTFYSGHGDPDNISFITSHDDYFLNWREATSCWGDKDAEWLALDSCFVLSVPENWISCFKGLHTMCGYSSEGGAGSKFGSEFAKLLTKEGPNDEPHGISQAWFLAGNQHSIGRKQRVLAESGEMLDEYIWGQGYVNPDPIPDNIGVATAIYDDQSLDDPFAAAGGPYKDAVAGQPIKLNGTGGSNHASERLFFVWDLDLQHDTDSVGWGLDNPPNPKEDDADAWGPSPWVTFNTPGDFQIRLMVFDDDWKGRWSHADVHVAPAQQGAPPKLGSPVPKQQSGSEPEIEDNFGSLPTEVQMPAFNATSAALGYSQMNSIANYWGMTGGSALDDLGNWNMTSGSNDLIVNAYTGSVMYVNREKAYIYPGHQVVLPTDAVCMQTAAQFLAANGINTDPPAVTIDPVTGVYRETIVGGAHSRPRTEFAKQVNYCRFLPVGDNWYPVVGSGGRMSVMLNEYSYVTLFVKIWREVTQGDPLTLYLPAAAISQFHQMGPKALVSKYPLPPCNRVIINNVRLGYLEDDFSTPQDALYPVYILDVTCQDDTGQEDMQVYLPAISPPIDVTITSPAPEAQYPYGQPIDFSGTAAGGIPPYTYEWSSDVDGTLGMSASISTTLSGNQREGTATEHVVTWTVTDSVGLTGQSTVRVKIVPQSAGDAKNFPDGSPVWLLSPPVTATFPGFFYVEDTERASGIRIAALPPDVAKGDTVSVSGQAGTTPDGERCIFPTGILVTGAGDVDPLGMRNGWLGGSFLGQPGVWGGVGLNNIGLLVRTWGTIVRSTLCPTEFWLDDGSSVFVKCLMPDGVSLNPAKSHATVTGVSSCKTLEDHFPEPPLDSAKWQIQKGVPEFSGSAIVLENAQQPYPEGGGEAIRSTDYFLYRPLTVIASSTGWANDTSLGFEEWYGEDLHYGIVITQGCLGIINQSKPRGTLPPAPPQNEVYLPISHWAVLNKDEMATFELTWKPGQVRLTVTQGSITGSVAYPDDLAPGPYRRDLTPDVPLPVRFNASNHYNDQLSIDYVSSPREPLILVRNQDDIRQF